MGILFLSCFSILDRMAQAQLKEHIRQELQTRDRQYRQSSAAAAMRVRKPISALATAVGLPQILAQTSRPGPAKNPEAVRETMAAKLLEFAPALDVDILGVATATKSPLVILRWDGTDFRRAAGTVTVKDGRVLREIEGQHYFVSSHPVLLHGDVVGWLLTGRLWLREMPLEDESYLLVTNGVIRQSVGAEAKANFAPGTAVPACTENSVGCEVESGGIRHLIVASTINNTGSSAQLFTVQPLNLITSPLLGMTRTIMIIGAIFSILGALGLAFVTGRAVSLPLKEITESCVRANESGMISEISVPQCRIAEVNALGQTLVAAVQTIEDGQSKLTQAYFQFMGAIVALLDARDAYTAGHSHRVSAYSEALARDFGLPPDQVEDIRVAALLHDIGKIGVPDDVLRKHERLTKEEFDLMKQHPTIGRKVLEQVGQFGKYLDAVEFHHENLDGTGYPRGLRGEEIPISARIVKVADVYDALNTDRPYRKKLCTEEVLRILRDGSGTHFDRLLVEIFLNRSVPSFQSQSGLANLYQAIGETVYPMNSRKKTSA